MHTHTGAHVIVHSHTYILSELNFKARFSSLLFVFGIPPGNVLSGGSEGPATCSGRCALGCLWVDSTILNTDTYLKPYLPWAGEAWQDWLWEPWGSPMSLPVPPPPPGFLPSVTSVGTGSKELPAGRARNLQECTLQCRWAPC